MKKIIRILLIAAFFSLLFYDIYMIKSRSDASREAMSPSGTEELSTSAWEEVAVDYINRRNDVINSILDGNAGSLSSCVRSLKEFECVPILDGDASLMEYMMKNPNRFKKMPENPKIEYSEVRQLTSSQVTIAAKMEGLLYYIGFSKVKNKWMLSRLTYGE